MIWVVKCKEVILALLFSITAVKLCCWKFTFHKVVWQQV